MSLSPPDGRGPLRRERLRTARLYFVCDARPRGADPEALLRAALDGGADIIQLRDKTLPRREVERAGATFRRVADTYSALFIVNDDPDLAHDCDADGLHVGQDDLPVDEARAALGPDAIIGLSTHTPAQVDAGVRSGADYISAGPIWETPTKEGRPATGLDLISHAAEVTGAGPSTPFFAIGGIDTTNAADVLAAGARRLCVVRAIRDADNPAAAASELRRAFLSVGEGAYPGG